MNKKYKLSDKPEIFHGVTFYRVIALVAFSDVLPGDVGGYVTSEGNLEVYGNAWVSGNAKVYGNAQVYGNARVYGNAKVYGNANVYGNAQVYGDAEVYDNAWVSGNAKVYGNAWVSGNANVYGNAQVYGDAEVSCDAKVYGDTRILTRLTMFYFFKHICCYVQLENSKWVVYAGCIRISSKKELRTALAKEGLADKESLALSLIKTYIKIYKEEHGV